MEISRALAEIGNDDPQARKIAEYAVRQLDFDGDITVRTEIPAHAQSRAIWAAEHLEIPVLSSSVDKAIAVLVLHGNDHQEELFRSKTGLDPIDDRAAHYGDWRRDQREIEDMERDR